MLGMFPAYTPTVQDTRKIFIDFTVISGVGMFTTCIQRVQEAGKIFH